MYLQPGVYMTPKFKVCVVFWSLFLVGIIAYNWWKGENIVWCYLLIAQQAVTWLVFAGYFVVKKGKKVEKVDKGFHLGLLTLCGPLLLSVSLYGFVMKEKLDINLYAVSFVAWWVLFTISVYCSFELTLDIALYYHRKKKAKYYDSLESPSSPLIK